VPGDWAIEVFEADNGSQPFAQFVAKLTPAQRVAVSATIEHRLVPFGMDLVSTEWMRPLKEGLYELRIRHPADQITGPDHEPVDVAPGGERILLRVFVHFHGNRIVLLLGGYDKGNDPSERRQQREIAVARKLLTQFRNRQQRDRRSRGRG
jgi:putative component of toxin-antitoxin plasmid stabilization module